MTPSVCPACGQPLADPAAAASMHCTHCGTPVTPAAAPATPRPVDPPPGGRRRIGRYQILGRIGAGAFGTVYRCHDPQLDREVALKVPHPGILDDPARRERFLREARTAAGLRHPHIVPVFEVAASDELAYLAVGLVDGGSLLDRLRQGPLDARAAATIVRELAEALAYAHDQGVIHRDVKPANVLLDGHGRPHLADFGLAIRPGQGERLTQEVFFPLGTPEYLAPEAGEDPPPEPAPAADQYALGVTLYELVSGRVPFEGDPLVTLLQAMTGAAPRLGTVRQGVPRDLETICHKAMARRPQDRYRSCAELAEDLRRFLADEPIVARPPGPLERLRKWARRRPALAALVGSVALLLVSSTAAAVLFALWTGEQARALRGQMERTEKATVRWGEAQQVEAAGWVALERGQEAEAARLLDAAARGMEQAATALTAGQAETEDRLRQEIERRLVAVRQEAEGLAHRQQARRQLQQQLADLDRQRDEVLFHYLPVVERERPTHREVVRRRAAAALATFRLDPARPASEAADALNAVRPHFASDEQRLQTVATCLELLLLLAEAEAADAAPPALQRASHLLDMAAGVAAAHGIALPRAWHRQWAACRAAAGDEAGARAGRERAARQAPGTAHDHLLLALEAFRQGRTDAAAASCEQALRLQPADFWPYYLQGLCHLKERRWEQAEAWLSTCVSRRPAVVWPRVLRASARLQLGNVDGARADLAAVAAQAGDGIAGYLVHLTQGQLALAAGEWEVAETELQQAIRCWPAAGWHAHADLAELYRQRGDLPAARQQLAEAIRLEPTEGRLYYTRAQLHAAGNDSRAARKDLEQAIRCGRRGQVRWRAHAHVQLGDLKTRSGQPEAALAYFAAALQVDGKYVLAYRQQAEALLKLGRAAEAGRALDAYLAAGGSATLAVYEARGRIHRDLREYPQAAFAFTRALEWYHEKVAPAARRNRASLGALSERLAAGDLEAMLRDGPPVAYALLVTSRWHDKDIEMRVHRGWAYLQVMALRLALSDFDAVLRRQPAHVVALSGRGLVRALSGQLRQAEQDAEAAVRAGRLTAGQRCVVAAIHARIAAQLKEGDPAGGRSAAVLARRHEERAVELIRQAVEQMPAPRRAQFWREQMEMIDALRLLRDHPQLRRLAPPEQGR